MKIGERLISSRNKPLIIAEIGINHQGNLDIAKQMALAAYNAGAECIKHQTHIVEDEMTDHAKAIKPPNADLSIFDVIKNNSLSIDDELKLKNYVEKLGLIYISTPFSRLAADFLYDIDVPAFKIGSGECDNYPFIEHIAKYKKPIILSTGMNSINSVSKSVEILRQNEIEFALLECTNLYPSPPEIMSLKGISILKEAFPDALVGFSDHSIGHHMSLAAVALGACIIERHFTDSKYRKGPDISSSMDPIELKTLIEQSSDIFTAIHNDKKITEPEKDVYRFARGSVVADKDLKKGHAITLDDIWVRRPGTGEISPDQFNNLLGRVINCDLKANQQIKWSHLK